MIEILRSNKILDAEDEFFHASTRLNKDSNLNFILKYSKQGREPVNATLKVTLSELGSLSGYFELIQWANELHNTFISECQERGLSETDAVNNKAVNAVIAQLRHNILDNLDKTRVPPEIYGELLNEDDDALITILKTLDHG